MRPDVPDLILDGLPGLARRRPGPRRGRRRGVRMRRRLGRVLGDDGRRRGRWRRPRRADDLANEPIRDLFQRRPPRPVDLAQVDDEHDVQQRRERERDGEPAIDLGRHAAADRQRQLRRAAAAAADAAAGTARSCRRRSPCRAPDRTAAIGAAGSPAPPRVDAGDGGAVGDARGHVAGEVQEAAAAALLEQAPAIGDVVPGTMNVLRGDVPMVTSPARASRRSSTMRRPCTMPTRSRRRSWRRDGSGWRAGEVEGLMPDRFCTRWAAPSVARIRGSAAAPRRTGCSPRGEQLAPRRGATCSSAVSQVAPPRQRMENIAAVRASPIATAVPTATGGARRSGRRASAASSGARRRAAPSRSASDRRRARTPRGSAGQRRRPAPCRRSRADRRQTRLDSAASGVAGWGAVPAST